MFKKSFERWIERNWIELTIGGILTGVYFRIAYEAIGHVELSVEWLVIPMVVLEIHLVRKFVEELRDE